MRKTERLSSQQFGCNFSQKKLDSIKPYIKCKYFQLIKHTTNQSDKNVFRVLKIVWNQIKEFYLISVGSIAKARTVLTLPRASSATPVDLAICAVVRTAS
jgi:hypothetical protein